MANSILQTYSNACSRFIAWATKMVTAVQRQTFFPNGAFAYIIAEHQKIMKAGGISFILRWVCIQIKMKSKTMTVAL